MLTRCRVPVLEIIRLAIGSRAAAIVFCCILLVNMIASSLGSAITMSRQGYAFARDNGLFWNDKYELNDFHPNRISTADISQGWCICLLTQTFLCGQSTSHVRLCLLLV